MLLSLWLSATNLEVSLIGWWEGGGELCNTAIAAATTAALIVIETHKTQVVHIHRDTRKQLVPTAPSAARYLLPTFPPPHPPASLTSRR